MKEICIKAFRFLILLVIIGKISNWFLNYSAETNQVINGIMFTLIGISYVFAGFIWDKKLTNATFLISGLYLIMMNFIAGFGAKSIIGIFCILTPIVIVRFFPEDNNNKNSLNTNF
ncbi:hypothetical protein [Kordia sp.]|uniref:hypothetical protein n=1 Tax=Kordia sp. TaxID=1965332 RepID=UPI003D283C7F